MVLAKISPYPTVDNVVTVQYTEVTYSLEAIASSSPSFTILTYTGAYATGTGGEGGGGYSFVACLSHLTIDHASLSRWSPVLTPKRDTSNIWTLITLLPYIT